MKTIKDKLTKYLSNIGFKYFIKSWIRATKEQLIVTNDKSLYISNLSKICDFCKEADTKMNNGDPILQSLFTHKCSMCQSSDIFSEVVERINKEDFICASCERDNKINSIIN